MTDSIIPLKRHTKAHEAKASDVIFEAWDHDDDLSREIHMRVTADETGEGGVTIRFASDRQEPKEPSYSVYLGSEARMALMAALNTVYVA